jgi:hypothetical protein
MSGSYVGRSISTSSPAESSAAAVMKFAPEQPMAVTMRLAPTR